MPRGARLDVPGTLHHVMIRGIEGREIFHDDEDRENFISRVETLVKTTGDRILAWSLMKNHVHFLLFSGPLGLPTFMRRLLTGYAVWFNRRHRRVGHLFQNRYKSIVCEEEPYLLELVRYIHLNPLRSRAVKTLSELDKYCWSGHRVLVGKGRNDWQEKAYILSQFGKRERGAIRAYRKFMEEGINLGRRPELVGGGLIRSRGGWSRVLSQRAKGEKEEYDSRILGSGDFVLDIIRDADQKMRRQIRGRGEDTSIEEIMRKVCKENGVRVEELRGGGQRRKVSKARRKVAHYLCREVGISMAEAGRLLGVGISAIAMAIRREERGGEI